MWLYTCILTDGVLRSYPTTAEAYQQTLPAAYNTLAQTYNATACDAGPRFVYFHTETFELVTEGFPTLLYAAWKISPSQCGLVPEIQRGITGDPVLVAAANQALPNEVVRMQKRQLHKDPATSYAPITQQSRPYCQTRKHLSAIPFSQRQTGAEAP